jgi:hypothetical protein
VFNTWKHEHKTSSVLSYVSKSSTYRHALEFSSRYFFLQHFLGSLTDCLVDQQGAADAAMGQGKGKGNNADAAMGQGKGKGKGNNADAEMGQGKGNNANAAMGQGEGNNNKDNKEADQAAADQKAAAEQQAAADQKAAEEQAAADQAAAEQAAAGSEYRLFWSCSSLLLIINQMPLQLLMLEPQLMALPWP